MRLELKTTAGNNWLLQSGASALYEGARKEGRSTDFFPKGFE